MTLRMLPDDALKAGDPALCRIAPDHREILRQKPYRPRGPVLDQAARDIDHAADWVEHVAAGRIGGGMAG